MTYESTIAKKIQIRLAFRVPRRFSVSHLTTRVKNTGQNTLKNTAKLRPGTELRRVCVYFLLRSVHAKFISEPTLLYRLSGSSMSVHM